MGEGKQGISTSTVLYLALEYNQSNTCKLSVPQLTPEHIVICHQQLQATHGTTEFKKCYSHKCKFLSFSIWVEFDMHEGALDLFSALFIHNIQCKKQSTERLCTSVTASGVARTLPLLGHSMGTLRLYETSSRSAEVYRGVWGHPPPQNLGILQTPRLVLRPYTVGVAKCKSLMANSRMMGV